MRIVITNTSGKPIYEQIEEQIKEAILSGDLAEGDLLPSIRQLARDLKISVITTTRAYSNLELQGFVAVMQGKGCFVLRKDSELVREQLLRRIEEHFCAAINAARIAKLPRGEVKRMLDVLLEDERYE
ncbi:MAG: GntR family transcriptional regulator [Spirochaetia bacterium]